MLIQSRASQTLCKSDHTRDSLSVDGRKVARCTSHPSNHRNTPLKATSLKWYPDSTGKFYGSTASLRQNHCRSLPRLKHSLQASASASPRPLSESLEDPPVGVRTAHQASAGNHAPEPRGGTQLSYQDSRGIAVTQDSGRGDTRNGIGLAQEQKNTAAAASVSSWDHMTRLGVAASALLLAASMVADLRANFTALGHLAAGSAATLPTAAKLLPPAFAFTVLVTVFASDAEAEATALHAIGAAAYCALLLQVASAGGVPTVALAAALCFGAAAAVMNAAYMRGSLQRMGDLGSRLWRRWRALLGCMGPAIVAQALTLAISPATNSFWPAAAASTAAIAVTTLLVKDSSGRSSSSSSWLPFWMTVPAWSATALLMMGPAELLVRHALGQPLVAASSLRPALLACAGNALLVPRALQLHNGMFLTATSWCSSAWWLVAAAALAARGAGLAPWSAFAAATAALAVYMRAVLRCHSSARSSEASGDAHAERPLRPWFVLPPIMYNAQSS